MQADVFCRVVDNYGDIGVTWRLARQLRQQYHWSIRLWVDDLTSFRRLEPRVSLDAAQQLIEHIEVIHWTNPAPEHDPHPILLCSFSCDLPATYLAQLHNRPALWINLEYLSAETWVEGCHTLPSLRGDGLSSHFFFPGFNARTGGLLREQDLIARRDHWQADTRAQQQLLERLELSPSALQCWQADPTARPRVISLFCYAHAPVESLLQALDTDTCSTIVLVPEGVAPQVPAGRRGLHQQVYLERIPFVSQDDYDQILWTADLNFVRGEDSVVRALWAGKPFVWQIYPQTEGTHLVKLAAWLGISKLPPEIKQLVEHWNAQLPCGHLAREFSQALKRDTFAHWSSRAQDLSLSLSRASDFAQGLHDFCLHKLA